MYPNLTELKILTTLKELERFLRLNGLTNRKLNELSKQATEADAINNFANISRMVASRVPATSSFQIPEKEWADRLAQHISVLSEPKFLLENAALSYEGIAVAARLGQAIRMPELYGEAEADQIDEDLGLPIRVEDDAGPAERDEAHLSAGMNASLLAFPPNALPSVLIQTGFELSHEFAPIPATTDNSDPGHTFHPGNFNLIVTVEQNLRQVIETQMQEMYGENWLKTRVSETLRLEWTSRYESAVAHGESPLALIQYSNFMELKDIVINRKHWREVFETIFKKKDHFSTSMERLHPIRKPLSHSRPIGAAQQIHLISEAAIIMKALGVDIFKVTD